MIWHTTRRALSGVLTLTMALTLAMTLSSCDQPAPQASASNPAYRQAITITDSLGSTTLSRRPQRVAALDMNEVDSLDQLGIPIAGMPKDFVPHFLARYKDDPQVQDLGSIVQPNLERVHALHPDLILITPIQSSHYQELRDIAPTLHYDVDFTHSNGRHIDIVKQHLLTLGRIFDKQALAEQKIAALDARVAQVRELTANRPEKALIVMHNNGAFSTFGVHSRYGFVFDALGVKPASGTAESGLHGQPISSEFIQQANPDILFVIDRTAVMEHTPVMDAVRMQNPLLRQTKAWQNGRVVFVDADAWYVTAASLSSLQLLMDDVAKGYRR